MTNINQINDTNPSFSVSNTKDTKNNGIKSFENALTRAVDNPQKTTSGSSLAGGLNEIISPTPGHNIIISGDIVSGKTDQLLNMLDSYSSKLYDPDISLKSIAPVLEEIKKNAGNLLDDTQHMADADEELKKIATQTAAMAHTEYAKFQRGDYLL